jgi:hypothetical protein
MFLSPLLNCEIPIPPHNHNTTAKHDYTAMMVFGPTISHRDASILEMDLRSFIQARCTDVCWIELSVWITCSEQILLSCLAHEDLVGRLAT